MMKDDDFYNKGDDYRKISFFKMSNIITGQHQCWSQSADKNNDVIRGDAYKFSFSYTWAYKLHVDIMIISYCSVMKRRITMMMMMVVAGISWQISWGGNWGNAPWPHLPFHRDSDPHTVSHLSSSLWTHLEATGKGLFQVFSNLDSKLLQ